MWKIILYRHHDSGFTTAWRAIRKLWYAMPRIAIIAGDVSDICGAASSRRIWRPLSGKVWASLPGYLWSEFWDCEIDTADVEKNLNLRRLVLFWSWSDWFIRQCNCLGVFSCCTGPQHRDSFASSQIDWVEVALIPAREKLRDVS